MGRLTLNILLSFPRLTQRPGNECPHGPGQALGDVARLVHLAALDARVAATRNPADVSGPGVRTLNPFDEAQA